MQLRSEYGLGSRHLARLNSASGAVAGKWLDAFPSSWWPAFSDESFIMALRFRSGIPVVASGRTCSHAKCNDKDVFCGTVLDVWGDHCVTCGIGGHLFTRHGALNNVLGDAGRAAGYIVSRV